MSEILVFEPALCCSTGVCGAEVDAELVRFAADVGWLKSVGVAVRRYNLAQEANAFAGHALVREALQREGTQCLPLVVVEGNIVSRAVYPPRAALREWSEREAGAATAELNPELAHSHDPRVGADVQRVTEAAGLPVIQADPSSCC